LNLQLWRKRNNLTQVDAAALLGVSQPYLSLLESGARPVSRKLRGRLRLVPGRAPHSTDDRLRAQLSALGYPGFAHVDAERPAPEPGVLLLDALSQPTLDARVAEALPWVTRRYAAELDWAWLVRQAKLRNLQNRLGFLTDLALASNRGAPREAAMSRARDELDAARLLAEATFCWDSMPVATRLWMRKHRSPQAAHWNVVTRLHPEEDGDAPNDTK